MTKDSLVFGSLAGITGNIFKEALSWGFYGLGLFNLTFVHMCAGILVNQEFVKSHLGLVIGFLVDYTIAGILGILIYILLKKTGTDLIIVKGLFFGVGIFLSCYGIIRPLISSINGNFLPLTVILYLMPNLIFGLTVSLFIKKYDVSWKNKNK